MFGYGCENKALPAKQPEALSVLVLDPAGLRTLMDRSGSPFCHSQVGWKVEGEGCGTVEAALLDTHWGSMSPTSVLTWTLIHCPCEFRCLPV